MEETIVNFTEGFLNNILVDVNFGKHKSINRNFYSLLEIMRYLKNKDTDVYIEGSSVLEIINIYRYGLPRSFIGDIDVHVDITNGSAIAPLFDNFMAKFEKKPSYKSFSPFLTIDLDIISSDRRLVFKESNRNGQVKNGVQITFIDKEIYMEPYIKVTNIPKIFVNKDGIHLQHVDGTNHSGIIINYRVKAPKQEQLINKFIQALELYIRAILHKSVLNVNYVIDPNTLNLLSQFNLDSSLKKKFIAYIKKNTVKTILLLLH